MKKLILIIVIAFLLIGTAYSQECIEIPLGSGLITISDYVMPPTGNTKYVVFFSDNWASYGGLTIVGYYPSGEIAIVILQDKFVAFVPIETPDPIAPGVYDFTE
jgi:hypothetical protein